MCGRTFLYVDPGILEDRFDARIGFEYEPRDNIVPQQNLATIRNVDQDAIVEQELGLLAPWADGPGDSPRPINARSETVTERPMFEDAFAERRCLVLADGFYEWRDRRASRTWRTPVTTIRPIAFG